MKTLTGVKKAFEKNLEIFSKLAHNCVVLPVFRWCKFAVVSQFRVLILHWFVDCGFGLYRRVLSYFEESLHGQQTLRRQPALFFP